MTVRTMEIKTTDLLLVKQNLSAYHREGDVVSLSVNEKGMIVIPMYQNGRFKKNICYSPDVLDLLEVIDDDILNELVELKL